MKSEGHHQDEDQGGDRPEEDGLVELGGPELAQVEGARHTTSSTQTTSTTTAEPSSQGFFMERLNPINYTWG